MYIKPSLHLLTSKYNTMYKMWIPYKIHPKYWKPFFLIYIQTTCIVKGHIKFDPLFFKYSLSTICVIRNEGLYPFRMWERQQKDDIIDVLYNISVHRIIQINSTKCSYIPSLNVLYISMVLWIALVIYLGYNRGSLNRAVFFFVIEKFLSLCNVVVVIDCIVTWN